VTKRYSIYLYRRCLSPIFFTHIVSSHIMCISKSINIQYIHHILLQVARLYRKSLKVLSSWVIDRDIFLEEATNLRNRFDAERGCSNAKAVRLLKVRIV